jgi:hypothetical protein
LLVVAKLGDVPWSDMLLKFLACDAGLEKELGELKDAAQYG